MAESIAQQKGIKIKSAFRYLQRAVATGEKQKIKNPTFAGLKKSTAARAKWSVKVEKQKAAVVRPVEPVSETPARQEYPETVRTGAAIYTERLPNPVKGESVDAEENTTITVRARFKISKDNTYRSINLDCTPREARKIVNAGSLFDAVAQWTKTDDGDFLQGATISEIEFIEIN